MARYNALFDIKEERERERGRGFKSAFEYWMEN